MKNKILRAGKLHRPNFKNISPSRRTYFNDSIANKIISQFTFVSFMDLYI